MKRLRVVLGVGERAKQYSLDLPRTKAVVVEDAETGIRFAASFQPVNTVVALDEAVDILPCVRGIRVAAPDTNLVVVSPQLDRLDATAAVEAGANYCVRSWMAVTAGGLLRVSAPRRARRLCQVDGSTLLLPFPSTSKH